MKHRIFNVLLLMILAQFVYSQQDSTISFSISEAQEYAIANNLTLENTRLDIDIAEKKVWENTAIGFPQINGSLDYQYVPGTIPFFETPDENGDIMQIPLATKNTTTYTITTTQLVFSGEYIVGLQAAKTYLKISKLSHEKQLLELKANILTNYFSILILENNLEIVNTSVNNIESLVNETKLLTEQGFLESTDADQLKITLNNLINSKNTIERQIEVSYKLFKILLGCELINTIVLSEDLTSVHNKFVNKPVNTEFDLSNNIDFKIVENQVELSDLLYKRQQTTYLPTISAFYNYQDKTNKASFDFTINHIIGAQLSLPIFSSFQRNAVVQQAKIEHKKSKNNRLFLNHTLNAQIQQYRYNYNNALETYKVTNQNVELSKKVFDNTTIKYKEGMVSSMDLTQSNSTYLQAESDNTNALYELLKSKIELEKILNEL